MNHFQVVTISSFVLASFAAQGAVPVPFISSVTPVAVTPGSGDFTLTVRGTGFANGNSKILWNGAALPNLTTCIAASAPNPASCEVTVPEANIAKEGSANITVINGSPARTSNALPVQIHSPRTFNAVPDPQDVAATPYLTGAVAIGDFNHDGKQDIATAGGASPQALRIFLGDGTGNFTQPYQANVGTNPTAVAVGDFNNDGNLDVAVANHDSSFVSVFLGGGTGKFTAAPSPTVGLNARSIVTGDFNGDGNPDLAVGNVGSPNGGGVQIVLGNGSGGFTPGALYPTAGARLAIGDFNSDGKLDLAATTANNTVNILTGDGAGNFAETFTSPTGQHPIEIHAADFNGDGKLDLAVLNLCGNDAGCHSPGTVSILLGDGLGYFIPASTPATDYSPNAFAVGDLNMDGIPDLVVLNAGAHLFEGIYHTVTVLLNNGAGAFNAFYPLPTPGSLPQSVAVADFNGDGDLDFTAGFVYRQAHAGIANTVTPADGSGQKKTFTVLYSDGNTENGNKYLFGAHDLTRVVFNMNTSFTAPGGCYVVFNQYESLPDPQNPANHLYLYDDSHKNLLGPITPGQPGTLSNSQCTLDGAGSSESVFYNNLTLKLALTFSNTFVGEQNIMLKSFDADGQSTYWTYAGYWNP